MGTVQIHSSIINKILQISRFYDIFEESLHMFQHSVKVARALYFQYI